MHGNRTRSPYVVTTGHCANASGRPSQRQTLVRRGLTFIVVVVAASILSIAALAALELLASTDAVNLAARRQALAAVEAEQALAICAESVKNGDGVPAASAYNTGMRGEALAGCSIVVTSTLSTVNFTIPPSGPTGEQQILPMQIRLLVATVVTPEGETIVSLERPVPDDDTMLVTP